MIKRITHEESKNYRLLNPEKDFRYSMDCAVAFTLTETDPHPWENVTYFGESFTDPTNSVLKPQWVYVMVNPSIPNTVKVGATTTSVTQRARELSSQTSSITPWYPVYSLKVGNAFMLEKEVHQYLEDRGTRVSPRREGFEISSERAIEVIKELGQKYLTK
jgi:hypothetical protein